MMHLGIYAHHGAGHLARAEAIAQVWEDRVTVLTSRPPQCLAASGVDVVLLPTDSADSGADTPDSLHHAPLRDTGLRDRMAEISTWIRATRPDVVLVDGSVEVALLTRLHGIPTAIMRPPGDRDDQAHRLCWETADLVLAPWGEPGERDGMLHVGLVSRFDQRPRRFGLTGDDTVRVVVAVGDGDTALRHEHLAELMATLPADHRVEVLGDVSGTATGNPDEIPVGGWVQDPWPALLAADVVIASASVNLVAEVAAAGTPLVVVPEARPYDEQCAHAQVLVEGWGVPRGDGWGARIAPLVERALGQGPQPLSDRRGARRAADALAKLAAAGSA